VKLINKNSVFIDSSTFLGMHSTDKKTRIECVNFFVSYYQSTIYMSLEQVGLCDDVIWGNSRILQDAYYPFMDRLHTEMVIKRIECNYDDIALVMNNDDLRSLSAPKAMLAAQVINANGILYTQDHALIELKSLDGRIAKFSGEKKLDFNMSLNKFYIQSEILSINIGEICRES